MLRNFIRILAAAGVALSLMLAEPQKESSAAAQLQAAINKETVEANLSAAIKQYGAIVAKYAKTDRTVAAKALVRMAECHQKLGDKEAQAIYERVLREYGDQKDLVAQARARLAAMGTPGGGGVRTRLLWDNALDLWGRASADGRYLSFVDWSSCDLAVRDLVAGQHHKVTNRGCAKGKAEVEASAVSPDGKRIAFATRLGIRQVGADGRAALLVIGMDGNGEKVLLHGARLDYVEPHSWSADGRWIAAGVTEEDASGERDTLVIVSADTGQSRRLPVKDKQWPHNATFSPDGKWLAYSIGKPTEIPTLLVRTVAGDESREEVLQNNANMMGWTPDGTGILFSRERGGHFDLYVLPFSGGKAAGAAASVNIPSDVGRKPLGVTTQGAMLYAFLERRSETVVLEWQGENTASGPGIASVASTSATGWLLGSGAAHFSDDGRRIFAMAPANAFTIREIPSGGERTITPRLASWKAAKWAPDGASILLLGTGADGKSGVYRMDHTTGMAFLLTEVPEDTWSFAPSRDGKTIYYGKPKKTQARDLATGTDKTLFETSSIGNYDLRVSHDGTRLAIRGGVYLAVVDLRSGQAREIYHAPEEPLTRLWGMDWSADDREIYTSVSVEGSPTRQAWVFSPEGGAPRNVPNTADLRGMSFSADGKYVVTTRAKGRSQVWALENFLPGKK